MCLCKSVQFKSCLPLIVFTFPFFPFAVGLFIPFSSRLPLCLFFLSFYTSSMKLWRDTGGISIRLSGKFIHLSLPPSVHLYLTLYCCSLFKGFICVCVISTELEVEFFFFSECLIFEDMNLSHKHGYISCISGVLTAHLSIGGVT